MSRLYLARHGEAIYQDGKRFWGATDLALSPAGKRQAEHLAERLSAESLQAVFSSPLVRAGETAKICAQRHGISPETITDLREVDFGVWEGLSWEEIVRRFPREAQAWLDAPWEFHFPGGESTHSFLKRVTDALQRILDYQGHVLAVTHGGPLRVIHYLLSERKEAQPPFYTFDHAGLTVYELDNGRPELLYLNDILHLKDR